MYLTINLQFEEECCYCCYCETIVYMQLSNEVRIHRQKRLVTGTPAAMLSGGQGKQVSEVSSLPLPHFFF